MILTVTLNISIDRAYRIEELKPGEVMRVRECKLTAGGKGLNVTKVAKITGADVLATGFAGGYAGAFIRKQLENTGISNDFVLVNGETRSCINIIDDTTGRQTEFLEPGFTVTPEDISDFLQKFDILLERANVVTISGSVPAGCADTIYADLVQRVNAKGKKVILDCGGKLLVQGIQAQPTLIKPNRDEFTFLTGISTTDILQFVNCAQRLQNNGIPYVVISMGRNGALLVCNEGVFVGTTPDIPVVNTVGCGDAMVAAFAVGFEKGYGAAEMLRFALAISAANAMTMETGFYRPEDLPWLLDQCKVKGL
jgi:tagatose 6-phosphate kinase